MKGIQLKVHAIVKDAHDKMFYMRGFDCYNELQYHGPFESKSDALNIIKQEPENYILVK